ncbi:MAG TPA: methyltransferase domain-containing protein [Pyrinomonadaceae bacterium]|nr:methyltransferase domain-containing protein [Pyrinomonadaceae bacterium]
MMKTSELDVDQLMSTIREAATRRHPNLAAYNSDGRVSLLEVKQTPHRPLLKLSTEFALRSDNTYHVSGFTKYHDRDFVTNAYRAILKREPDEAGFLHNLTLLRSGVYNKIDILSSLRYSDEGKLNNVTIKGLRFPAAVRTLERIPIAGYLLQMLIVLARLPAMVRHQREFQGYLVAQQLAIADHLNDTQRAVTGELDRHTSSLATIPDQLHALETRVNERILSGLLAEQQKLQRAEAELLLLSNRLTDVSQTLSQELGTHQSVLDSLKTDVNTLARNLATEENRTIDELREWDQFYSAFEEQFRGSAEEVEERLRFYLPFLAHLKPESQILDVGSGRGDWLALLRAQGFNPRGVEVNEVLAERSRQQGLDVVSAEMMVYLGQQPDNSLDLVTVFHLIEHFNIGKLIRLLDEVKRALRPGGLLILETPSPENLVVAACNFHADPTHYKPIYPQTLIFLLDRQGFGDLHLHYLHPVENSPFTGESEGSQQLDLWFFGPRDFAAIARKA